MLIGNEKRAFRITVGITVLAILLLAGGAGAVPVEEWNKTFEGPDAQSFGDEAYSVQQTTDGGYVLAGETNSKAWLIKTDTNGNKQWSKVFGSGSAKSVQQTTDGRYIIGGGGTIGSWSIKTTDASGNQIDASGNGGSWLIKTDALGNILWQKTFEGGDVMWGASVQQTTDGGYIFVCDNSMTTKACLIKTDTNGNMQWDKTFGGFGGIYGDKHFPTIYDNRFANTVQQTSDGCYIVGGYTYIVNSTKTDGWIIKVDPNGNEQWNKTVGLNGTHSEMGNWGPDSQFGNSVRQTSDGGYIFADTQLIKTDPNGKELWNKTLVAMSVRGRHRMGVLYL